MKNHFIVLFLLFITTFASKAQSLDEFITILSEKEGAAYQVFDSDMMKSQILNDVEITENNFLNKMEVFEIVVIENPDEDLKSQLITVVINQDNNVYVPLFQIKDEKDNIAIFNRQLDAERSVIYILATDEEGLGIVKMSGNLDQSDLEEIVNDQKSKYKK